MASRSCGRPGNVSQLLLSVCRTQSVLAQSSASARPTTHFMYKRRPYVGDASPQTNLPLLPRLDARWESSHGVSQPSQPSAPATSLPWLDSPRKPASTPRSPRTPAIDDAHKRLEARKAIEWRLTRESENPSAGSAVARLQTVQQAVSQLVEELPAHGPLLKQVQREIEAVAGPGGGLTPQPHNLKPDPRLMLPSPYYQSELRRAEANLRLAVSHGPRLRRAVRRLRIGVAEARSRLAPFALSIAPEPDEVDLRLLLNDARLSAARADLRGPVEPEGELMSPEVEATIWEELGELQKLLGMADERFHKVCARCRQPHRWACSRCARAHICAQ